MPEVVPRVELSPHTLVTTALILAEMSSSHSEHMDHHHLNHQPATQFLIKLTSFSFTEELQEMYIYQ
jgi:hypothetical protein